MIRFFIVILVIVASLIVTACNSDSDNGGAQIEAPPERPTATPTLAPTNTENPTDAPPNPTETDTQTGGGVTANISYTEQATLGLGTISGVHWLPNGLILNGGAGLMWFNLANPTTPELTFTLPGYRAPLAISPDGLWVAAITPSNEIALLNETNTPEILPNSTNFRGEFSDLIFSPDGSQLAAITFNEIRLWDVAERTYRKTIAFDGLEWVATAAYTPAGVLLAAVYPHIGLDEEVTEVGEFLRVIEAESRTELFALTDSIGYGMEAEFSPDASLIRVQNNLLRPEEQPFGGVGLTALYDVATGTRLDGVSFRDFWISAFSYDSTHIATQSPSGNGNLFLYELPSGDQVGQIRIRTAGNFGGFSNTTNPNLAIDLKFSPDDTRVALVTGSSEVHVVDIATTETITVFTQFSAPVYDLAFSPDGTQLAVGGINSARLFAVASGESITGFGQTGRLFTVAFSPDGTQLATGSESDSAILWNLETGQPIQRLNGVDFTTYLGFTPDGTLLINGGQYEGGFNSPSESLFRAWDLTSPAFLPAYGDIETLEGEPTAFAMSRDGERLAAATAYQFDPNSGMNNPAIVPTLALYDTATGSGRAHLDLEGFTIPALVFSADGTQLIAGCSDGMVRVYSVGSSLELIAEYPFQTSILALALNPAGDVLAIGQTDGQIILLDATTGNYLTNIPPSIGTPPTETEFGFMEIRPAHAGAVLSLAFSPDGIILASGGADGLTKLWTNVPTADATAIEPTDELGATPADETQGMVANSGTAEPSTPAPSTLEISDGGYAETTSFGGNSVSDFIFTPDGNNILLIGNTGARYYRLPDLDAPIFDIPTSGSNAFAFSPDGQWGVGQFSAPTGIPLNGPTTITAIPFGGGDSVSIESNLTFVQQLLFSPDSTTLTVIGRDENGQSQIAVYAFPSGEAIESFDFAEETVSGATYTPDGDLLVALSQLALPGEPAPATTPIRIVNVLSGDEILRLDYPPLGMLNVTFSPDTSLIHLAAFAMREVDGGYSLDTIDEPPLRFLDDGTPLNIPGFTAHQFAFTYDGTRYAFLDAATSYEIEIVDIASGETVAEIDLLRGSGGSDFNPSMAGFPSQIQFSPDDSRLGVLDSNGVIKIYTVSQLDNEETGGLLTQTAPASSHPVQDLDFSPDGTLLAAVHGGGGNLMTVWQIETGAVQTTFNTFAPISSVLFAPDGQKIAIGTSQNSATLWDFMAFQQAMEEAGNGDGPNFINDRTDLGGVDFVTALAYSTDGTRLVTAGYYQPRVRGNPVPVIRIWDLTMTPRILPALPDIEDLEGVPAAIALNPDGSRLAVAVNEVPDEIFLFDARTGQPQGTFALPEAALILELAYRKDGTELLVMQNLGGGVVLDARTGAVITPLVAPPVEFDEAVNGYTQFYTVAALSPDETRLAIGRSDGLVAILDTTTGQTIAQFQASAIGITALDFAPDGQQLIIGSADGSVRLFSPDGASD